MSSQETENLTEIFKALSHPLRQDIIRILADYRNVGFTVLQKELNRNQSSKNAVKVGSIYHHISLLGNLVVQESGSKSWSLSNQGWFAYDLLTSSSDRNQFLERGDLERKSILFFLWRVLAPPELFLYAKKSLVLFLGWQIIFVSVLAFVTAQTELVLIFVFFADLNPEKDILISLASILISWLFFTGTALLLSKQFLRVEKIKLADIVTITVFLGISLLPLTAFPLLLYAGVFKFEQQYVPLAIATVLQLWVILLTTRSLSVHFFVRMERAGIISLISIYMMVLLGLILGF